MLKAFSIVALRCQLRNAHWNLPGDVERLNRCRAVTDKAESAWQKSAILGKGCLFKSVCREVHCVALAA
jgi:hypothetical protein